MDGEKKFVLTMIGLTVFCITLVYVLLLISLWPYRVYVNASILGVTLFVVLLWRVVEARGKLTEQELRQVRYRHHEETPLDRQGEAQYWPQGAQMNPHLIPPYYQSSSYQQPYQTQEQADGRYY
jgi:hypothetical protein